MINQPSKKLWFSTANSNSRKRASRVLEYGSLEQRQLLASVSYDPGLARLTIEGTSGNDQVEISSSGSDLIVFDQLSVFTYDIFSVQEIWFNAGAGDDVFRNFTAIRTHVEGHHGNDTLQGGAGDDFLRGGPGNDTIDGGAGADQIFGTDGDDLIMGGDGNDYVRAGYGADDVSGGNGDDLLNGDWGADTILGDAGNDTLYGSTDRDVMDGGVGNDRLYGQHGDDEIRGGDGADRLRGGPGEDYLYGGNDNDYIQGDQDNDYAWGEAGSDRLYGFTGDNYINGGSGDDFLYGYDGIDELYGEDGDDVLRGGASNDLIYGGDGDDFIRAEAGDDIVYAGAGNDRVLGNDGNDEIWGEAGVDSIEGNDGADLLRGGAGFDTLSGGADADSLIGGVDSGDSLRGGSGKDRFLTVNTDSILDRGSEDAQINFEDVTSSWTEVEISVLDRGFAELFAATDNNRFLTDSLPSGDLTFFKYDSLNGSAGINYLETSWTQSWNGSRWVYEYEYHREIQIADWDETSDWYNLFYQSTAIHELAHNWDSELELMTASGSLASTWNNFLSLSGWTDVNPHSNGFTQSHDGNWWYQNSASFAEEYGQSNPNEDMATVWEAYFHGTDDQSLQSKLDIVLEVINSLRVLT